MATFSVVLSNLHYVTILSLHLILNNLCQGICLYVLGYHSNKFCSSNFDVCNIIIVVGHNK